MFRRFTAAGQEVAVNPDAIAAIVPSVANGRAIIGESMLLFTSPTIAPMPVKGGVDDVMRQLEGGTLIG